MMPTREPHAGQSLGRGLMVTAATAKNPRCAFLQRSKSLLQLIGEGNGQSAILARPLSAFYIYRN